MDKDIEKIYFTEEDIKKRVGELGRKLSSDYKDKNPLLLGVLKGSFIFMADLVRNIDIHCEIEFVTASSYGRGTETSGEVYLKKALDHSVKGRHIIIVEDILDSGVTLSFMKKYIGELNPDSIKICTFLDKPARRQTQISADYVGYECSDAFFVGYGLDYAEHYRNLPYIGSLKSEIYM